MFFGGKDDGKGCICTTIFKTFTTGIQVIDYVQ